jgi:VWFA-related protein
MQSVSGCRQPSPSRFLRHLTGALALSTALQAWAALAGQAQVQKSKPSGTQQPESTFELRVQKNLVLVRVVVRDSKRSVVTGLTKDGFRLYDDGKPQVISEFSVETTTPKPQAPTEATEAVRPQAAQPAAPIPTLPERYLSLYFDDLNMDFEAVVRSRDAAQKFLTADLTADARVAIFTSSGSPELDFTADRVKLHDALFKLRPNSRVEGVSKDCPDINDFLANQIVNLNDDIAIQLVRFDATNRCGLRHVATDEWIRAQAQQKLGQYEIQAANILQRLAQVARRMAILPGQRTLILVSGGFMPLGRQYMVDQAIDHALNSQVVISALDAKGLAVILPEADAQSPAMPPPNSTLRSSVSTYALWREAADSDVMAEVADATGGAFVHNTNDLLGGFQKLAAPAESYYVLAFTPTDLKANGAFHKLKVELVDQPGYAVQARRGYFAPGGEHGHETPITGELEAAVYSQNESMHIPIEVHSQFYKTGEAEAHLTILTRIDVSALQIKKENERNLDSLTLITAVFDQDGKFEVGTRQRLDLHLKDATFAELQKTGMTVKTEFNVKSGAYLVREVVHDEQGNGVSAVNHAVEIPY